MFRQEEETIQSEVENPPSELDGSEARKGRFLVYWMTTTSMTTLFSYTKTITVGSLVSKDKNSKGYLTN